MLSVRNDGEYFSQDGFQILYTFVQIAHTVISQNKKNSDIK